MARARTPWLGRIALALVSAALALGAAELAVRAMGLSPARYAPTAHLESEDKRSALDLYPDDPRGAFPLDLRNPDVRAEWANMPGIERAERAPHGVPLRFGAELCRGGDLAPAEGRARVLVIGDSFTEGQGVVEERTFSARLDRALGAQVINCGRRGYDFPRLREWFELRTESFAPDVVLYAMVLNDPQRSEAFHERQRFIDDWIVDRRRRVTEGPVGPPPGSRLFALVEDRVESMRVGAATTEWYRDMVAEPNRVGWEATLAHLEAMHAAMEARGGVFVVALWPLLVELDGGYPFTDVHRTIREALEARGVRFVDTLDAFEGADPETLWVHATDRHPNADAHARFAERVQPALQAALARLTPR